MKRILVVLTLVLTGMLVAVSCGGASGEVSAPEPAQAQEADHHEEGDHHSGEGQHEEAENHREADAPHHGSEGQDHDMAGAPVEGAKEIRIVATEFAFAPDHIHMHVGETVNIVLVNEGAIEHEVEIEEFGFHLHAGPGETAVGSLTVTEEGEFEFGCHIAGHYEAGMFGRVKVSQPH